MPALAKKLGAFSHKCLSPVVRLLSLTGVFYITLLSAQPELSSSIFALDYRLALDSDDGDLQWSRLSLKTETNFKLATNWSGQIETRLELADDEVGLGTTHNYAQGSRPWVDNDHVRFELDRAYVMWRKRADSLTIGKQVTPWGVLDGIQVTDRFDPVRRRDFVFSEIKPERLARWGLRWRTKLEQWMFDTSMAFDGTSSQQAAVGDTFFMQSSRFTGGLPINQTALTLVSQEREHNIAQSTFGLRVSHPVGDGDLSLLAFRGPDNDPVLSLASEQVNQQSLAVYLDYQRRSLIGATYDVTVDDMVWRMELAYIPDQGVNVLSNIPLSQAVMPRVIAGAGLDWRAPQQWFVNVQLVVDYLDAGSDQLTRPSTDTILTLRLQRPFMNERVMFKTELLTSVNQGDGSLRPALSYALNDQLKLQAGLDWVFGDSDGQFGQFKPASRLWLAATYTF